MRSSPEKSTKFSAFTLHVDVCNQPVEFVFDIQQQKIKMLVNQNKYRKG